MKRLLFLLLLLAPLGGCSLLHRSGQPAGLQMSAKMEAEHQAREKARHKGLTYNPAGASEGGSGGEAKDAKADDSKKTLSYKDLPEGTKNKYNKEGLLKNHLPAPRPRHVYETHPLKGTKANEEARKLRKHHKGKNKGKDKDKDTAPADDAPAKAPPAPAKPGPKPDPN